MKNYTDANKTQYHLLMNWYKAKDAAEDAKAKLDEATRALKAEMDAAGITHLKAGIYTATRIADGESVSYDYKRLDADHPGLREQYATRSPKEGGIRK